MTEQAKAKYYDVYDDKDQFLMRTTMVVIAKVWDLHKSAVARCVEETAASGGVCQLHANGRAALGGTRIIVQEAVGPRSNY